MGLDATANIIGILWGVAAKAMRAPRAAPFVVSHRSLEHVSKMLTLQCRGEKQLLLLSLHLEADADRTMKGAIGGGNCYR